MKRLGIITSAIFLGISMQTLRAELQKPPVTVQQIKEIAAVYNQNLADLFNDLTPQERVFIYYMYRASLVGNMIASDQSHRDALAIIRLLEYVLHRKDALLQKELPFDAAQCIADIETHLGYLWTNHSQYFVREHENEKRTPERLGLTVLTEQNLITALEVLEYEDAQEAVHAIARSLFDTNYEPTLAVANSIEKSAVNFYSPDFTDEDFDHLDPNVQSKLNAYFYIDEKDGKRVPAYQVYSTSEKYDYELGFVVYWLEKAHGVAQQYPKQFDEHLTQSLALLIEYFKTGDEEVFKLHSRAWLKSNSRVDYVFGFIETYSDPKSYRAIFQADVTIKSLDIGKLNAILPNIERRLPIKKEFMRQTLEGDCGGMPNASINVKAFTAGHLGPINWTAAYCLPNYGEIRAQEGSKQIIYHSEKGLGELVNPQLSHRLFNGTAYYDWFEKHDPDYQLMRDIWMFEVILHETLGHGSGKLTSHTFKDGDMLTIEGKTYAIGDTIPVTSANIPQLLKGYGQTLEELRAEIIALLASIECYDDFAAINMLKDWPKKVEKEILIDFSILNMARVGLRKLLVQADEATRISGAHAQANTTILYYLIEKGAIEIRVEDVSVDETSYKVLDVYILDREKAIDAIKELANMVQEIKSTGDGLKAEWLIETYGTYVNQEYMRIMKDNMKAVVGDVKISASLHPIYTPCKNDRGDIIDIDATWPENVSQAYLLYRNRAFSIRDELE